MNNITIAILGFLRFNVYFVKYYMFFWYPKIRIFRQLESPFSCFPRSKWMATYKYPVTTVAQIPDYGARIVNRVRTRRASKKPFKCCGKASRRTSSSDIYSKLASRISLKYRSCYFRILEKGTYKTILFKKFCSLGYKN